MRLPERFLNDFDLSIQHGNFRKTNELIREELRQFDQFQQRLNNDAIDPSQLEHQQLVDYFIIKSAEAELIVESEETAKSIKFVQKYLDQLNDIIYTLQDKSGEESNRILMDYLKFVKTEFMRTLMDANRRLGNLEEIDHLLDEIDKILKTLCIPTDTPRYIKSQAYNRNYKAIQLWNYGKPEEAKKLFQQCIDDFKSLDAPADVAMIYNNLGLIYLMRSKFKGAIKYFKKTLDYFEDKSNTYVVATLLSNIGEAYREIGDIPQALSYHKRALKLRKSIGRNPDTAQSYLFLGSLFKTQGRLDDALENFMQSLNIYKKINHELNIARLLSNIGDIYLDRGQFHQAQNYYQQSISYLEQSGNPVTLADSYLSIGIIQKEKGNYNNALKRFQQSADLREDIDNQPLLAIAQCEMVECYVLENKMEPASELLIRIKGVVDEYPEHKILAIYYKLMQGIFYQNSIRVRDKVNAENLYREILDLSVIPYKLEVRTTKQIINLLLEELQNYGEEEVLMEIVQYLEKLEILAKQQSLMLVLVEVYLIRHQLQLLLGESQESKQYLDQATKIVNSLDVPLLSKKLNQVVTFFDQNTKLWNDLDQLNLALSDRLKLSIISSSLQNSRELLHLYQDDPNQPILIMVLSEAGTISVSYEFKSDQNETININPHLIASFISALNSFGRDTFETSELLETLTYGNHKLVSRRIGSYIISLLYEGTKLQVNQQLIDFELFLKKSGIFSFIEENRGQEYNLNDEEIEIIENIFK